MDSLIPLIKVAAVFAFMIVLLRVKLPLGAVLALATGLLLLLFGRPGATVRVAYLNAKFAGDTVSLTVTILMLNALGQVFAATGDMDRLIVSLEHVLRDSRAALGMIPSFIGFLPMPGGAMLSAPPVNEIGDRIGLDPADRVVINHWLRHVWEYVSPLYPGVILLIGFKWLDLSYAAVVVILCPMTVLSIVVGVVLYLLPLGHKKVEIDGNRRHGHNVRDLARALWPVAAVTAVAAVFGKEWIMTTLAPVVVLVALQGGLLRTRLDALVAAVLVVGFGAPAAVAAITGGTLWNAVLIAPTAALVTIVWLRRGRPLGESCRKGFTWMMGTTLLGVCIFKEAVEPSGAAAEVGKALSSLGLHPYVLVFVLPFIVGLLAGATMVYVGTTLPLLGAAGLIAAGPTLLLAYAAGFMGVMISPVHPCLALTIEYFKAPVGAVYRKLTPAVVLICVAAIVLAILGWPFGIV
jgi:hypothetical protein